MTINRIDLASRLERKWWFIGITALLASLVTRYAMEQAGLKPG
ncbi:hypothetical protein [Massilia forsythiae]|nr:hypothetical protein [Massilia forsythiae]